MDTILYPIMWVISWVMYGVHKFFTAVGMSAGAGPAWVLSIVGLTVIIRILIIPLFNKQTRATRLSQELQPEIQKIQKKYKGRTDQISQQRQQEEMMALYRDRGTSPFASCLPALIQMPIFFSLFRLLYAVKPLSEGIYQRDSLGAINNEIAKEIGNSTLFGAPLTSAIGTATEYSNVWQIRIVAVVMIALMVITLFLSQRLIMTKNMPQNATDPDNPAFKMQKYMLYGMPLIYVFTGYMFQVGVLVYWLTGNIWNIGQQYWLISTNPAPGSAAYKERQEKIRKKRLAKGLPVDEDGEESGAEESRGQRQQPLGKGRSKKARAAGQTASSAATGEKAEEETPAEEVRGKDGLTEAERAQKRYERRQAQRQRSKAKNKARQKRQNNNGKKRNF
ncbi:MAG: membrane protein insertase YidC [Trueperella sp.]|nr:membrane protein insertase YidC [Trueperella sp.]